MIVAGTEVAELMRQALAGEIHYERTMFRVALGLELTAQQEKLFRAVLVASATDLRLKTDVEAVILSTATGAPFIDAIRPTVHLLRDAEFAACLLTQCQTFTGEDNDLEVLLADTESRYGYVPGFDDGSVDLVRANRLVERLLNLFPNGRFSRWLIELGARGCHPGIDAVAAALLLELGAPPEVCGCCRLLGRIPVYARIHLAEKLQRPNRFIGLATGEEDAMETESVSGIVADLLATDAGYMELYFRMIFDYLPSVLERRALGAVIIGGADSTAKTASSSLVRLLSSSGLSFDETFHGYLSAFGFYHMGAMRECSIFLRQAADHEEDLDAFLDQARKEWPRAPGFGHRFYRRDPRGALLDLCEQAGLSSKYLRVARAIQANRFGRRPLPINIDGVGAAVALTVQLDLNVADTIVMVIRIPRLIKDFLYGSERRHSFAGLKVRRGLL
jgi:hypothetical protein